VRYDVHPPRPAVDHATVLDDMAPNPAIDSLRHFPGSLVWLVDGAGTDGSPRR